MLRCCLFILAFVIVEPAVAGGADFLNEGNAARAAGRTNDAIAAYTKAIEAKDTTTADRAEAYRRRGSAWGFLGENIKGIADFTEALKLAPDMGAALTLRGYLRGVVGQNEAAEADQRAALALASKITYAAYKPWVLQHYADLQRRRGEFAAALKTCDEAAAAGELADVHLRRAWTYLDMGREADAKASADKFFALESDATFASYWPDERGAIDRLKQLRSSSAVTDRSKARLAKLCANGVASEKECKEEAGVGNQSATAAPPGLGKDGAILPLAPEQLDAGEVKTYATLVRGSDDERQFLYTRGYLRYCKLVVAGGLQASQLPPLPARKNWDRRFLTEQEATNIVDVALTQKLAGKMPPQRKAPPIDPALFASYALPALDAEGRALPLTPGQLTADEKKTYDGLAKGGVKATQFLHVRGYLRFCRLVIAGTIKPLQLPKLPARENWSREHMSPTEAREVLDVALGMKVAARLAEPKPQ